jgi:Spy/CpxP family protein refolding chaperone
MKILSILTLTIALTVTGMPAFAQRQMAGPVADEQQREAGGFSPEPGQGGPASEERREEVRKKIEAVRIWRLTEELKLDTNSSAKLSSLLSSLDQQRRDTMREQMETMRDLRTLLKSAKPDESKTRSLLEKLERNHHEIQGLKDQELKGIKNILTIEQQARFLLFQQEFQREMQNMISAARNKGQGRDNRGPGGPGRRGGPMNDYPERDMQSRPPR